MAKRSGAKSRTRVPKELADKAAAERQPRKMIFAAVAVASLIVLGLLVLSKDPNGADPAETANDESATGTYEHVHGLGVNPKDRSLMLATHDGLFRSPAGETTAERVGDSTEDLMGFGVVGPDEFVASGHPGAGSNAPANLGLIRSSDAGLSWQPVSLEGQADFHILRSAGDYVYGVSDILSVSRDKGATWKPAELPGSPIGLAVNPSDPGSVVVAAAEGVFASKNAGGTWKKQGPALPSLLAWPTSRQLYSVTETGDVSSSSDHGRIWHDRGWVGGQPVAFTATRESVLVALSDFSVRESRDQGRTWSLRVSP